MADFITSLEALMITDGYKGEEVDRLIKKYPEIIIQGIMTGNMALGATIMAIKMKENQE